MDKSQWHRITNANLEAKLGDCSQCGSGVPIRVRQRPDRPSPRVSCGISGIAAKDRALAKRAGFVPLQATAEELRLKLSKQGGTCALCPRAEDLVKDHCHRTGRFRGWLCRSHNRALGLLGDDPGMLRAAAEYLEA
jgi:hypothetical protein